MSVLYKQGGIHKYMEVSNNMQFMIWNRHKLQRQMSICLYLHGAMIGKDRENIVLPESKKEKENMHNKG